MIFRFDLNIILITLFVFIAGELHPLFAQNKKKEIIAKRIESEIDLDGRDNDEEWKRIPGDSSFLQIDPDPGSPPAFKTVVKVAYSDNDLYVLFICYDTVPDKLVTRELKYDGFTSGDDNVKLIIDTFGDERNGYWFATNPLSVKNDALVSGRGYDSFNEDWDAIWEVKSAIQSDRWCAEFRIPLSSLKFPGSPTQKWGINFQRGIRRLSQDVIWSGAVRNGLLLDLTRAGSLLGIENIQRGNPVYLLPYLNVGYEDIKSSTNSTFKAGLDLKYGLSDAFTLDLTLNTDFAQVEADIAEINLSRFPLFIPEKREFFLEGNKLFSFDLASNNMAFIQGLLGYQEARGYQLLVD
ncbi:MAG: carbohydrate binding family 9 domain-containing protein [Ignavibacteriales bacterium]|nr:carbohydrate binding family 9 domain-containing protein [Ignavibacteriales bacterium]